MSTPVFLDPKSSTQADGAQSSRVPVPLLEDPYEAIRQAYLDGTDTESEPFEDPIDTETPESPLTIAPPIPLSKSTPPVLVPILCRTARMVVRIPHTMSSGLSTDLPLWKRYRGTSELVEDSDEDDHKEDEEIKESMDSDSMSEDAEDEGPTTKDEDHAAKDEGLTTGVEGPGMDNKGYGLDDESRGIDDEGHSVESVGLGLEEEEEAVPEGQRATLVVSGSAPESERLKRVSAFRQPTLTTWTDPEDGIIYIDIPDYPPPAPHVQTPPSPEWTSGSLLISPSPSDDPSPISSPMIPLTIPSPLDTPAVVETKGFLTKLGAQVQIQEGLISDHAVRLEELSPALFERYDRDIRELFTRSGAVKKETFSQRPVLALEAWAGQTDAQRAALWHAISNVQGENQDLRLQLAKERRTRLELAEVVDGMKRGKEPRGGDIIGRFWNGLPRMSRAEMVDQARFAWGFLSVFGNANSDRVVITSRTGSYPDTRLRQ
ncbi:hypothetical protein Tco_1272130 [Tanacetum coccineum]